MKMWSTRNAPDRDGRSTLRSITRNPTMTASDKRQKIDQLYFRSIEVAGHGLAVMRKVDAALVGR